MTVLVHFKRFAKRKASSLVVRGKRNMTFKVSGQGLSSSRRVWRVECRVSNPLTVNTSKVGICLLLTLLPGLETDIVLCLTEPAFDVETALL